MIRVAFDRSRGELKSGENAGGESGVSGSPQLGSQFPRIPLVATVFSDWNSFQRLEQFSAIGMVQVWCPETVKVQSRVALRKTLARLSR